MKNSSLILLFCRLFESEIGFFRAFFEKPIDETGISCYNLLDKNL